MMFNRFKLLGVFFIMTALFSGVQSVCAAVSAGYHCQDVPHLHPGGCKMTSDIQNRWTMPVGALVINDGHNKEPVTCQNTKHHIQCNEAGSHTRFDLTCPDGHFVMLKLDLNLYYYCSS